MIHKKDGKVYEAHIEEEFGQRKVVLDHEIDVEKLREDVFEVLLENEPPERVRLLREGFRRAQENRK